MESFIPRRLVWGTPHGRGHEGARHRAISVIAHFLTYRRERKGEAGREGEGMSAREKRRERSGKRAMWTERKKEKEKEVGREGENVIQGGHSLLSSFSCGRLWPLSVSSIFKRHNVAWMPPECTGQWGEREWGINWLILLF